MGAETLRSRRASPGFTATIEQVASPSVDRVVRILDYLTTHPGSGFTLSELSRRLDLSKTTVHRALTALTDRGLVVRNPVSNEYRLGFALVPMGAAAERSWPALTVARTEIERLAAEYDCEALIVAPASKDLVIVARAGLPGPNSSPSAAGQRKSFVPPIGISMAAWSDEEAVEAWFARLDDDTTDADRKNLRDAIAHFRRRRYAVALWGEDSEHYRDLQRAPKGAGELRQTLAALRNDYQFVASEDDPLPGTRMLSITAPVFGPDAVLLFTLAVVLDHQERAPSVAQIVREVVRSAGRVTQAAGGEIAPAVEHAA